MQVPLARTVSKTSTFLLLVTARATSHGDLLKDLANKLVRRGIEEIQRDDKLVRT
jgi:hypothetical protein